MSTQTAKMIAYSRGQECIWGFSGETAFLSNFYVSPFYSPIHGLWFSTVEHFFQAAKAQRPSEKKRISEAPTPGIAKRLGRQVALDLTQWEHIRDQVMLEGLRLKFDNDLLAQALVKTDGYYLVEANTWRDTYWGVDYHTGHGRNMLGDLLMRVREECRARI